MNALIYAPSGGGKTVQVTRTPGKRNLLLCSDNSSVVLNQPQFKRDNLDIQTVSHWLPNDRYNKPQTHFHAQFETAVESKKYANIFVDNLSDLFDLAILEMDESGRYKDMRQAYQSVYQAIKRLARKAGQLNCNVIFTAWANQQEIILPTGERGVRIEPKLPAKILDNVLGLCNIVGYVTPNKERTEWYYITEGTQNLYAKNQITGAARVKPEEIWG